MHYIGRMLFTIGHSNRPLPVFTDMLKAHGIMLLVDIRKIPRSRFNPHFNGPALERSLAAEGIAYLAMPELGGMRTPRTDSPNTALPEGVRGFADFMDTAEFD